MEFGRGIERAAIDEIDEDFYCSTGREITVVFQFFRISRVIGSNFKNKSTQRVGAFKCLFYLESGF